jgi:hypothetical protein
MSKSAFLKATRLNKATILRAKPVKDENGESHTRYVIKTPVYATV